MFSPFKYSAYPQADSDSIRPCTGSASELPKVVLTALVNECMYLLVCHLLQGFMRIRRNHGKHGKCALASYPAMVFRNTVKPSA
jgi:hypothetical protein